MTTPELDDATIAFVKLLVWLLSILILYLIIKYAVLEALRINRRESEQDRSR